MKLNLFKHKQNSITEKLSKSILSNTNTSSSESIVHLFPKNELIESIPLEFDELSPKFITVNKLDFNGTEIHCGITNDPRSVGGIRYLVTQPRLSIQDKKNFDSFSVIEFCLCLKRLSFI